jgi:hypothetical protein
VPISTQEIGRQFDRRVQPMLDQLDMNRGEYREVVRQKVFLDRLTKALADAVPTAERQVELEYLLFQDESTAKSAADLLSQGEDWAAVVARFGPTPTPPPDAPVPTPEPPPTAALAGGTPAPPPTPTPNPNALEQGEAGWFTRHKLITDWSLVEADADAVLALLTGKSSAPLNSTGRGFYVVHVLNAEDERPVAAEELQARKDSALEDWLNKAKDALTQSDGIKRFSLPEVPEPPWFVTAFDQLMTPMPTTALTVGTAPPPGGVTLMTVAAPPAGGTAPPPAPPAP